MRAACSALAVVMLALALGACGESDGEKAQNSVCNAKDDIGKQVDELASLTPATVTTDAVTQNLDAIKTDLEDISDAQSDLSSDRRNEVEAANKAFASSVQGIASEVGRSLSASDAKAKLVTALQQLEASYQKSFARLSWTSRISGPRGVCRRASQVRAAHPANYTASAFHAERQATCGCPPNRPRRAEPGRLNGLKRGFGPRRGVQRCTPRPGAGSYPTPCCWGPLGSRAAAARPISARAASTTMATT
jgi:hypothetical protein